MFNYQCQKENGKTVHIMDPVCVSFAMAKHQRDDGRARSGLARLSILLLLWLYIPVFDNPFIIFKF